MDIEWIIYHLIHNDDEEFTTIDHTVKVDSYNHDVFERFMVALERNKTLRKVCIERALAVGGGRRRTPEDMYYLLCTVCQLPLLQELKLVEWDICDLEHPYRRQQQQQQRQQPHQEYSESDDDDDDASIEEREDNDPGGEKQSQKDEELSLSSSSEEEEIVEDHETQNLDDRVDVEESEEEVHDHNTSNHGNDCEESSSSSDSSEPMETSSRNTTEDLRHLLSTCHHLTHLHLHISSSSSHHDGSTTASSIMEHCTILSALAACPCLQSVQLELSTSVNLAPLLLLQPSQGRGGHGRSRSDDSFSTGTLHSLTVECYGGVPFEERHILPMAHALCDTTATLQCLDLEHTLSPWGVLSMAAMLRVNTTLTRLRLSLSCGSGGSTYSADELCLAILESIGSSESRSGLIHFHNYRASNMNVSAPVQEQQVTMLQYNQKLEYFVLFHHPSHDDDDENEDEEEETKQQQESDGDDNRNGGNHHSMSPSKMRRLCSLYLKLNRGGRRFLFPDRHRGQYYPSSSDPNKDGTGNGGDEMNKKGHCQQRQQQQHYSPCEIAPKHIWVDRLIYHRDDVECLLYYLLQNPSLCKREPIEVPCGSPQRKTLSGKNQDQERLPLLEGGPNSHRQEDFSSPGTTTPTATATAEGTVIAIPTPPLSPYVQESERLDDDVFDRGGTVRSEKKQLNHPHGSEPLVPVDEEVTVDDDDGEDHLYPSSKRSKLEAPSLGESSSSDTLKDDSTRHG
jgi:hypothetical protein